MEQIEIIKELKKDNKNAREIDLKIFANALLIYTEATANINQNGAICRHPRTGAPMENPYLKIQATQGGILSKMRNIKSDRVLKLIEARKPEPPPPKPPEKNLS